MQRGSSTRPFVLSGSTRAALLTALFCSYFGSLWYGALHFPHPYDWRRNVISNLLSPRDNPSAYWVPSLGVALAGICMLPLAAWIDTQLNDSRRKLSCRLRRPAFLGGILCLILSAVVVPQHTHAVLGMRHAHEALARASAIGFGAGMLCACGSASLAARRAGNQAGKVRILRTLWKVTTLLPITGALASGLVVALTRMHGAPAGVVTVLHNTVIWHLAFWEWLGSAAVFIFFASGVWMLGGRSDSQDAPALREPDNLPA